jgi:hypothetical protein
MDVAIVYNPKNGNPLHPFMYNGQWYNRSTMNMLGFNKQCHDVAMSYWNKRR